jgi:UDP-N-acetylmuramyl tripeptide synthase
MIGSIWLGKIVRQATRLRGNGGSALPGLIVERINPGFVKEVLGRLKHGVVVVSGTNGKTTTTKIVVELLEKQGLKVFTNNTGSNFVRGVISAIVQNIGMFGKFRYDIAVLELDEAHAVKFTEVVPIEYALLLNVQRDQLDRFGEIDHTAKLLEMVAGRAKKCAVINREDPRLNGFKANRAVYFGLAKELLDTFPSDDDLLDGQKRKASKLSALVSLQNLEGKQATYKIDGKEYGRTLKLKGIYNAYNAAGALALVKTVVPEADNEKLVEDLAEVESAFGRGETFRVGGQDVELLLVKNPSAFQLSISSFADDKHDFMIAINDNIADGRDVSWLWNVDFRKLPNVALCSGVRAYDMALRLKYDEIEAEAIEEDLEKAVQQFIDYSNRPKRIFATYTAMLKIRKILTGKSLV